METYRHSGMISYSGIVIASAAGIAAAAALGVIYSFGIVHIPYAKLNFLLTMFFGALIGVAVGWGAKVGKIRNNFIAAAYGFACGLVGLYVAWAVDLIARVIIPQNLPISYWTAFSPDVLWIYIKDFYADGMWAMKGGENVKGPFLATIWAVEALVVLGGATFCAPLWIVDHPFCEGCNRWTKIGPIGTKLSLTNAGDALAALLSGDFTALTKFAAADSEQLYLELELARCPTCDESYYLRVYQVTKTVDKKGKESVERKSLATNMRIAAEDVPLAEHAGMVRQEPTDGAV